MTIQNCLGCFRFLSSVWSHARDQKAKKLDLQVTELQAALAAAATAANKKGAAMSAEAKAAMSDATKKLDKSEKKNQVGGGVLRQGVGDILSGQKGSTRQTDHDLSI